MADHLPHAPASTCSAAATEACLYVGKSKDLRTRVKSYFYGDERKKIEDLLAQTTSIDGETCASELEALVLEARLIRAYEPKYNRRGKTWRRYAYVKIDPSEAFPSAEDRAALEGRRRTARTSDRSARRRPPGSRRKRSRRSLPVRPVHDRHGRADAVRAVRAGGHGPVRRAVRRPRRSRALRRARPEARLLPDLPGRAPRSARATHGAPRPSRSGTRRRGWSATGCARWRTPFRGARADAWLVGAGAHLSDDAGVGHPASPTAH
jgi:hypothetical protein